MRVAIRAIDPPADPGSGRPARRRDGRPWPPSPVRVLLVEDDRRLTHNLRYGLQELGIAADAVHRGDEAIELATGSRALRYDVVVLDVDLPGADGLEVCRRLRDSEVESAVLMLTAHDGSDGRSSTILAGADDYMVKPFALHELVGRVRSLARRARGGEHGDLLAGPLVLRPDSRRVEVAGCPVELTGKEFDLLEYFMLHPARVLAQSRILDHVWSYDFAGGRNLVEVYMGRLRRKLTEAGLADPFVTVRRAGYRFDPPG